MTINQDKSTITQVSGPESAMNSDGRARTNNFSIADTERLRSSASRPVISHVQDARGNPIEDNGSTQDTTVTLFGTAQEPIVDILDGNISWGTAEVAGDETWNKRLAGLEAGRHQFTAKNRIDGQESLPWSFIVDSAEEVLEITSVRDSEGTEIPDGGTTDDTRCTVAGVTTSNATVLLFDGEVYLLGVEAGETGNWDATLENLSPGRHSLRAKSASEHIESNSWIFTITASSVQPVISRVQDSRGALIENGGSTQDTTVIFFGTADETMVEIRDKGISWGAAPVDGNKNWTKRLAGLELDGHEFTALNMSDGRASAPWLFTVMSVEIAPEIMRVRDSDGNDIANGGSTEDSNISLSGTATANSTVEILDELTSWGSVRTSLTGAWEMYLSGLDAGFHRFRARDTNSQLESQPWEFKVEAPLSIDTTPMHLDGFTIYMPNWGRTGYDSPGNTLVRQPSGGVGPYSYSSSNTHVALVSSQGKVQGTGRGEAIISVRDQEFNLVTYSVFVTNVYASLYVPNLRTHAEALEDFESLIYVLPFGQRAFDELIKLYKKPFPLLIHNYWCTVDAGCSAGLALSFMNPQQELGCTDPTLKYYFLVLLENFEDSADNQSPLLEALVLSKALKAQLKDPDI